MVIITSAKHLSAEHLSAKHLSVNSRSSEWTMGWPPFERLALSIQTVILLPRLPSAPGMHCGCVLGICFEWYDTNTVVGFMCADKWHALEGLWLFHQSMSWSPSVYELVPIIEPSASYRNMR